jgi:UDP-GlcNAc:undecaprenyl-phosphate/decaprenyl-phosphate GlcNAc-1-phosphate transferase
MQMISNYIIVFLLTLIVSTSLVPFVIRFAKLIGAVDKPDNRKIHNGLMPRIGGLAIYIAFLIGFIYISSFEKLPTSIIVGISIIALTGFIDDKFQIKPWQKLLGQVAAAGVILSDGFFIKYLTIPFIEQSIQVSIWIALPISFLWIIGVTNSVNLIDGLDGLASGVTIIAGAAIFVMALIMNDTQVALLSIALIGATLGFWFFNFHPAKIFMGDTGSLLLGFLLSILSIIGFKQVTIITLIIPIIILAVPIADTAIAIIRRKINNQKIMDADKNHLHHRLLASGLTQRQSVLFIYGISFFFGTAAILLYKANLFTSTIIFLLLLLVLELLVEGLELINKNYKPLINLYTKFFSTKINKNNKSA